MLRAIFVSCVAAAWGASCVPAATNNGNCGTPPAADIPSDNHVLLQKYVSGTGGAEQMEDRTTGGQAFRQPWRRQWRQGQPKWRHWRYGGHSDGSRHYYSSHSAYQAVPTPLPSPTPPTTTAVPTPLPSPTPPTTTAGPPWSLLGGGCQMDAAGCVSSSGYPNNYPYYDVCVIAVNTALAGAISVLAFDTEEWFDRLWVNGERYSGIDGPDGVVPTEDIFWASDGMNNSAGWKICIAQSESTRSTTSRAIEAGAPWSVLSGDCQMDAAGCVSSSGYPNNYPPNDICFVRVNTALAGAISVLAFDTELSLDRLWVNGKLYHGTSNATYNAGPEGVVPTEDIFWASDISVNRAGWKICMAAPAAQSESTRSTTSRAIEAGAPWSVLSGGCQMDAAGCVSSSGYPNNYPNLDSCVVGVNTTLAGAISVAFFDTESFWDVLLVNDVPYDGPSGSSESKIGELEGVVPTGNIVWKSDGSDTRAGWKICMAAPAAQGAQALLEESESTRSTTSRAIEVSAAK